MDVYWLEQTEEDVPSAHGWLGSNEVLLLDRMRFPKRWTDWKLGRWTAKQVVAAYLNLPDAPSDLAGIQILPAPSGVPQVWIANKLAPVTISISHSSGKAVCAIARSGAALGCDLEFIEPRSEAFALDYFGADERATLSRVPAKSRPIVVTLLWSAKESALKTLGVGLRLDTRSVMVDLVGQACASDRNDQIELSRVTPWQPLTITDADRHVFSGWWQRIDDFIRTIVAAPAPSLPICLD